MPRRGRFKRRAPARQLGRAAAGKGRVPRDEMEGHVFPWEGAENKGVSRDVPRLGCIRRAGGSGEAPRSQLARSCLGGRGIGRCRGGKENHKTESSKVNSGGKGTIEQRAETIKKKEQQSVLSCYGGQRARQLHEPASQRGRAVARGRSAVAM